MRKLAFSLGLIFSTVIGASAQEKAPAQLPILPTPQEQTAPPTSKAEITFEKDTHDFGVVEYGGNGTYEFKFKNTGKEPLIISDARGSCGCTVPTYPKNVPIKPGETQTIKVTYDTKRPGNFHKTVTVSTNTKTPTSVLTITGKVNPAQVEEAFPANDKKDNGAVPLEKH
jgi:archaellum component FlaG (FlaF/FlaG flagellin family)